jgi:hypothetical protein
MLHGQQNMQCKVSLLDSWQEKEVFVFSEAFRPTLGPVQPRRHRVPWAVSSGIKGWNLEGGHPPPLNPRLRMSGAVPPLPICSHGVYRDNFTLLLPLPAIRIVGACLHFPIYR